MHCRTRVVGILVSLAMGCGGESPHAVIPTATANKPLTPAMIEPLFVGDQPSLPVALKSLVLGKSVAEVKQTRPQLFDPRGLILADHLVRVFADSGDVPGIVSGVTVRFYVPSELERHIAAWGEPDSLEHWGHGVRMWFNEAERLRAVVVSPHKIACCGVNSRPVDYGGATDLVVEQYLEGDDLLPTHPQRFGFEGDTSILGATVEELQTRFGPRLSSARHDPTQWYLRFAPLGNNKSATYVSMDLTTDNRVGAYRLEGHQRTNPPETLLRNVQDRLLKYWGAQHTSRVSPWHWYGDDLQVEWETYSPLGFKVRDVRTCPRVENGERDAAETTTVKRWIEQQKKSPRAKSDFRLVSEAEPVWFQPFTPCIVEERTTEGGVCSLRYLQIERTKPECRPEQLDAKVLAEECCDDSCVADLSVAYRRLSSAIERQDRLALRAFIDPKHSLLITDGDLGSEDPPQVIPVTRGHITDRAFGMLGSISRFDDVECPDLASNERGVTVQCSFQGADQISATLHQSSPNGRWYLRAVRRMLDNH